METEEREIQDKTRGSDASNVVRLPRDWLGPREELVPFGPSSRATEATEPAAPAASASDFWGERSDALHDALEGPEPVAAPAVEAAPRPAIEAAPRPVGRSRARWPVAAALVLAVVLVTVVASWLTTGGLVARSSKAHPAREALFAGVGRKIGHTSVRLRLELRPRLHRPRTPRTRSNSTPAAPVTASASVAGSTSSATSTPTNASYPAPPVHVSSPSSAPVSHSSSQPVATSSGSGGGGASTGSGAGPTGEGALVGPASCNC